MTLQEYEEAGGCYGCAFYEIVDPATRRRACTFKWYEESDDWKYDKNCDEISE